MGNWVFILRIFALVSLARIWSGVYGLNPAVVPDLLYFNGKPSSLPSFVPWAYGQAPPFNPRDPNVTEHYAWRFVEMIEKTDNNSALSAQCFNDVNNWLQDALTGRLYALKMMDSFGKPPAGISQGNILWFGDFDLCLNVKLPELRMSDEDRSQNRTLRAANYCLVRIETNGLVPVNPAFGTCLPRSCTPTDHAVFLEKLIHFLELASMVRTTNETLCVEHQPVPKGTEITHLIFGFFGALTVWATIIHLIIRVYDRRWKRTDVMALGDRANFLKPYAVKSVVPNFNGQIENLPVNRDTSNLSDVGFVEPTPAVTFAAGSTLEPVLTVQCDDVTPFYVKLIMCFSVVHNINRIFGPASSTHLVYLDGIRVLSLWWVMLGHVYLVGQNFFGNRMDFRDALKGYGHQVVLNATFAVDTFFLLSGLVVTYSLLRECATMNSRWPLVFAYVRRIYRLTPLWMATLLIFMYLVPNVIDGPFVLMVKQMGSPMEECKKYWWTTLAYVNNFIPEDKTKVCMAWTWFISVDFQLFLLTPPIVALVVKYPRLGLMLLTFLLSACIGAVAVLVAVFGLPLTSSQLHHPMPASASFNPSYEYLYDKPWMGGINYIVGVMLAIVLFRIKPTGRFTWNIFVLTIGWTACALLAHTAVYGLYYGGLENPTDMSVAERTVYAALARPAWALAISWVIVSCYYDFGSVVKSFLSLPFWRPLSRLTYSAFLFHYLVIQYYFATMRELMYYSFMQGCMIFLGSILMVYPCAFMLSILVEQPLIRLEQLLLFRRI
ncbi:hypothetical protein RvY_00970 [Ramazzottius varieornatus]|uniref:Nose resistant-to-fluoxetine protein N-terminal domain-containing protein n=1 Tax=Ramazzottius varieornatus TaxID=947166 RepID=A0A1D1UIA1_RAMVA|nr:hypothetical protein RvY_00970 [Ramazzottius varieornatus]